MLISFLVLGISGRPRLMNWLIFDEERYFDLCRACNGDSRLGASVISPARPADVRCLLDTFLVFFRHSCFLFDRIDL